FEFTRGRRRSGRDERDATEVTGGHPSLGTTARRRHVRRHGPGSCAMLLAVSSVEWSRRARGRSEWTTRCHAGARAWRAKAMKRGPMRARSLYSPHGLWRGTARVSIALVHHRPRLCADLVCQRREGGASERDESAELAPL